MTQMTEPIVTTRVTINPAEIFAGLIALIAVSGTMALAAVGNPIPDVVTVLDGAVVGFYFGAAAKGGASR